MRSSPMRDWGRMLGIHSMMKGVGSFCVGDVFPVGGVGMHWPRLFPSSPGARLLVVGLSGGLPRMGWQAVGAALSFALKSVWFLALFCGWGLENSQTLESIFLGGGRVGTRVELWLWGETQACTPGAGTHPWGC